VWVNAVNTQNIKDQQGNGHKLQASRLLEYLPAFYREDEFMGQFLLIFESILTPIENTVNALPLFLDPKLVPESLLPWLASWLDLVLDESWPLAKRRKLVARAAELYRWRGTWRGLSEYLEIYAGVTPEIIEYIPGMPLDSTSRLGINTQLGSPGTGNHFTISVDVVEKVDIRVIKNIIEAQKPACTTYTLRANKPIEKARG